VSGAWLHAGHFPERAGLIAVGTGDRTELFGNDIPGGSQIVEPGPAGLFNGEELREIPDDLCRGHDGGHRRPGLQALHDMKIHRVARGRSG
jgi:hypothetical protein